MKKLIAISVVFALVAGVAFAVDLGGTVIGGVNVIDADSGGKVQGTGRMERLRVDGGGEVADGKFGGYVRLDKPWWGSLGISGYAWWKPIDQIKLTIGENPDGWWGKDGNTCWAFYGGATDTIVSMGGAQSWGNPGDDPLVNVGLKMRNAFYGGDDFAGLHLEITPVDMVSINIGLPFIKKSWSDVEDIFLSTHAQVALNMSFGTIAFSFVGAGKGDAIKDSEIFAYFGLTAIDNLRFDFGIGKNFQDSPLNLGLGVTYGSDSWGIKFRTMLAIPLNSDLSFGFLFDVLPYFVINDSFKAYISGGIALSDAKDFDNARFGWHINPYIEVGDGPKFLAGIKVYQMLAPAGDNVVNFQIPIALVVSF